jgi:signal transduction histidine kinase
MAWTQRLIARLLRINPVRVDELVGLVLFVQVQLAAWLGSSVRDPVWLALVGVVIGEAVAVRRRRPLAGVLAVIAAISVTAAFGDGGLGQQDKLAVIPAMLLVFYGLGAFASGRRSLWLLGLAIVVASFNSATKSGGTIPSLVTTDLFAIVVPWVLGRMVRERGARERAYRETAERIDAGRELHAHEAAYGERARIARELHDVIAHSVSVMVIQAGAARTVMDSEPERAETSLRSVERAGREALAEMRRLLGVLDADRDPRALAPQPGLADINGLLARTRASGLRADLLVEGEPAALSPALDLCAYRIVQEALTNAIKHAAPASAAVRVSWGENALELEISDDGRGPEGINGVSGGHGIAGMRERAALHGGSVDVGPGPGGGFTVHAHLPLAAEAVA